MKKIIFPIITISLLILIGRFIFSNISKNKQIQEVPTYTANEQPTISNDSDPCGKRQEQKSSKKPVSEFEIDQTIRELKLVKRKDIKINYDIEKYCIDANYSNYGDLIGGYFSSNGREEIAYNKKFDVDNDGIEETIIATTGCGGNGVLYDGYVIKDNKIILSFPFHGRECSDILPSDDRNGLIVKNEIIGETYVCPDGYTLYKIAFENNMFKPIWQQETRYLYSMNLADNY